MRLGSTPHEDIREEVAYLLGMEAYVYGFPLVIMDATKAVTTAASESGQYSAPINQFGRTYVDPDFKNVVRISRNSLWSFAFLDLDSEPFVFSQPEGCVASLSGVSALLPARIVL